MRRETQHTSRVPERATQRDTEAVSGGTRGLKIVLATILMSLTGSHLGMAQTYEAVYGGNTSSEDGTHLVRVSQPCSGGLGAPILTGGFIAVGTTDSPEGHTDVHVVRTDQFGVILWEKTYDIGGAGNNDEAFDIVETPAYPGFAITGRTDRGVPNGYDAFILKINCSGVASWSGIYGGTGEEAGNAIIEAYGGTGVSGTLGDLVVAGYSSSTASTGTEAWMFRVDGPSGATVRWSKLYLPTIADSWTPESGFNDIIEPMWDSMEIGTSPNLDTILLGDLVAVGWCKGCHPRFPQQFDYDGFAVRTDFQGYTDVGNSRTGAHQGDLTGFALWSTFGGEDRFNAIIQAYPDWPLACFSCPIPPNGDVENPRTYNLMVTGMATGNSIVVLEFPYGDIKGTGAATTPMGGRISSPSIPGVGQLDIGRDLVEAIGDGVDGSPLLKRDIVITGEKAATTAQGGQDAYILVLRNAFGAARAVVQAAQYGGSGTEQGNSIVRDYGLSGVPMFQGGTLTGTTPGFVVAANTTTPYQANDPADMYVIKADDNLATDCEMGYTATPISASGREDLDTHSVNLTGNLTVTTGAANVDWDDIVCGDGAGKAVHEALAEQGGLGSWGESGNAYVLPKGSDDLEIPAFDGDVQLYLYNARGAAVWISTDGSARHIPTSEFASGYYVLRIAVQGRLIEDIVIIIQ